MLQVATFPGGLELMLCAGFIIEEAGLEGNAVGVQMFLRHPGLNEPEKIERLRYVRLRFVFHLNCYPKVISVILLQSSSITAETWFKRISFVVHSIRDRMV